MSSKLYAADTRPRLRLLSFSSFLFHSLYFSVGSFISVYTVDSSSIVLRATTRQQTSLKIRIKRRKGLNMAAHNELLSLLLSKGLRSPASTRDLENITRLTVNPQFAHVVLLSQSELMSSRISTFLNERSSAARAVHLHAHSFFFHESLLFDGFELLMPEIQTLRHEIFPVNQLAVATSLKSVHLKCVAKSK